MKKKKQAKTLICSICGDETPRRGPMQKYCQPCSEKRDLERKRLWAREHPAKPGSWHKSYTARKSEMLRRGEEINRGLKCSIAWDDPPPPEPVWHCRFWVPFSYAASKNHIYTMRSQGHVALRKEGRAIHDEIAYRVRYATKDLKVCKGKVWLDILVQKPNHRGDAVNVIDLVCDGVKVGLGLDDRWFCIRKLDWQIIKEDPRLYIGVSQTITEDHKVCSYCGRVLPFTMFGKCAHAKDGVGRKCKDCSNTKQPLPPRPEVKTPCSI